MVLLPVLPAAAAVRLLDPRFFGPGGAGVAIVNGTARSVMGVEAVFVLGVLLTSDTLEPVTGVAIMSFSDSTLVFSESPAGLCCCLCCGCFCCVKFNGGRVRPSIFLSAYPLAPILLLLPPIMLIPFSLVRLPHSPIPTAGEDAVVGLLLLDFEVVRFGGPAFGFVLTLVFPL